MPEAPPAPPPTAVPPADVQRSEPPSLGDFDSHFNDLEDAPPAPPEVPAPPPEPKSVPPKDPETGKFVPKIPEPKPAEKPAEKPTEPKVENQPEFSPPQVAKPSQLKQWAERMGSRAQKAESELNKVKAKLTELETRPAENGDYKALTEQLAQARKRLEDYEGELRLTKYERSTEYKDKYEKPYQDAVNQAYGDVDELIVTEPNPEDPEHPRERKATRADFDEIYQMPLGQAGRVAKAKFGDSAFLVLQHRTAIKNVAKAAVAAIEEHKAKATTYEQEKTAQEKLQEEGRSQMFSTAVQAIQEKFPSLFSEREGDTEWNTALTKGRQIADLAYGDRQGLSPQQQAILDAQVYNRIAAFPALKTRNAKLEVENERLTKELEEIRGSGPGKPTPGATPPSKPKITNSIDGIDTLPE